MVRKVNPRGDSGSAVAELGKKKSFRMSATSGMRWKEPTSKATNAFTQFVHDYGKLQKHIPDSNPNALIEATRPSGGQSKNMAINRDCKPRVFGPTARAFLGSAGDQKGNY